MKQTTAQLRAKIRDLEASFNLRWKADMRAIKRWQKATGRKLVWPDHADLCVWLLEQLETVRGDAKKGMGGITESAMMFCIWESRVRDCKAAIEPCSEREKGDPTVGDAVVGPCDLQAPAEEQCENCQKRALGLPRYQECMQKRASVKRTPMRRYHKLMALETLRVTA